MWTTPIHGLGSLAKSEEGVGGTLVFALLLPDYGHMHSAARSSCCYATLTIDCIFKQTKQTLLLHSSGVLLQQQDR